MSVTEVLDGIKKLSPTEKQRVIKALVHDEEARQVISTEERQAELHRQLLAEGVIKNIPTRYSQPPTAPPARDFEPVPIQGKPLSETIIEERR